MKRVMFGLGVTVAAAVAAGCTSASPAASSGSGSGATSVSGSGAGSGLGSGAATGGTGTSSGGSGSSGSTLYSRLGEHAGIRGAINAIVAQELGDTDIKSYFFNQVASPVPAGHPTADQIEECFTDLLGSAAGGPETYPTTVTTLDDAGADAGAFTCRDLTAIHAPLMISGGTFDKFVMIAGGVLVAAQGTGPYTYTTADITTVAGVLTGTKPAIVDSNLADAGSQPFPAPTSTLYGRLGGHAGIRGAINAIVAQELGDTDIKSYFFNQVASPVPAGHPTADQIEECFTDLLGSAAGGPETYPTTVTTLDDAGADAGAFTCRDMTTVHAPLMISGGTFDKFVMIAGGVLVAAQGTGPYTYTTADITTVAGVLTGTKPAIVDSNLADAGSQPFPGPDAQ
jgi:hypothetical protein